MYLFFVSYGQVISKIKLLHHTDSDDAAARGNAILGVGLFLDKF